MSDLDDEEPSAAPVEEHPALTSLRILADLSDAVDRARDKAAKSHLLRGMATAVRLAETGLNPPPKATVQ